MTASVVIWSALAPWLILLWLVQRLLPWRGVPGLLASAAAASVLLVIPWFGHPVPWWSASLSPNFSVVMAALLVCAINARASGRPVLSACEWRTAWIFGSVAILALYPSALGLGPQNFDSYALGWPWLFRAQSGLLLGVAGLTAAVLLWRGNRFGFLLLLALAGHALGFQESDNFWDYLLDPLYGAVSLLTVLWMLVALLRRPAALPVFVLAAACLPGCAWAVHPPAAPRDPVTVWVTEYGRHSRVALPSGRSTFLEYGFGEWNFYAREQRGFLSTLRAAVGLGSGAFSRRELQPASDGTLGPAQTGGTRSASLQVEGAAVAPLRKRLEERWAANQPHVIVRSVDGVPVSSDPQGYHLFANSNHAAADRLRDLGCRVTGFPILSNFRIVPPAAPPSATAR